MKNNIEIINTRENNLKGVDLEIPKNAVTIFTGVSGSGKSSIVFDTLAEEAGRLLVETFSSFARQYLPKYKHPEADEIRNLSTVIAVDQKRLGGNSRSTLGTVSEILPLIRILYSRFGKPRVGSANYFSFNDPLGFCPECDGIGRAMTLDLEKALDMDKSLEQGAILLDGFKVGGWVYNSYVDTGFFDKTKPLKDFTKEEFDKLVYAKPEKVGASFRGSDYDLTYEGLAVRFIRQNVKTAREKSEANQKKVAQFMKEDVCTLCHGDRYSQKVLNCKINDLNIAQLTKLQLTQLVEVLSKWDIVEAKSIISSTIERLQRLIDIGLDYISLDRETSTLSGGESQRVKMVKYLSSSLSDICYIFDEPSIGLHARDVHRLNELLIKLRDKGNTVIVVEHDPDVIKIADHVVDVGPMAGRHGGTITYQGDFDGLLQSGSLTGRSLKNKLPIKDSPCTAKEFWTSSKSSLHNLKDVALRIPKGIFTCITGVAGSGKSTLVNSVFANEFECVRIDQTSVAGNIRSNPATYTGIMDSIRKLFAKQHGLKPGMFSYNSDGACKKCGGTGFVELNLSFMDASEQVCDECNGDRYGHHVLEYKYKGLNIVDINKMTVEDSLVFFESKEITSVLQQLSDVGLGYMSLGQSLNTLSGGECQRIKLAKELNKKGNIYILDEPTTGLHLSDIQSILKIIDKLVQIGNTVVVIEHNLEIIKQADWIVDIGPEGGDKGGTIVFEGTVADLKKCKSSYTAQYLDN